MDRGVRVPPVTHTHALFADQSHPIPDNLVALLGRPPSMALLEPEGVFGGREGVALPSCKRVLAGICRGLSEPYRRMLAMSHDGR